MALAISIEVKHKQTAQERARAAILLYHAKPTEQTGLRIIPARNGRHLDVDAVLARSLPSTVNE